MDGLWPTLCKNGLQNVSTRFDKHMQPNNALVSDVYAAALRAFYNAPQRER